jgi:hypothetical protein
VLQGGVFIGLVAFAVVMVEVQVEFVDDADCAFSVGFFCKFFNCHLYKIQNENLILDVYYNHPQFLSNSLTYNFMYFTKIYHLVAQGEYVTCPKVLLSPLAKLC